MLDTVLVVLQVVFVLIGGYQTIVAFFGLARKDKRAVYEPQKSFAILVAAHNEEKVVGALLENLRHLNYPKELYEVFVIADNCTDNTASIARSYGVHAFERHDSSRRGKGYAIEWMLRELWKLPRQFDAIVMFDADNLASPDYLRHMNNDLCAGHRVIQAYLDTKNPHDSWITSAYAVSYWFCNRLWQMSRTNLGLANYLGGTGMCFEAKLLREIGWGATSLVEDLEFTMRCVKRGVKPIFNYEAKVFDEKPLSFKASWKQRLRWMQGHFEVARRYFFPLIWQGIKERSWTKIDMALYALNVYNVFITGVVTTVLYLDMFLPGKAHFTSVYAHAPWLLMTLSLLSVIQFPIALYLERAPKKIIKSLITFPLYLLSWYPLTFYAFFTQTNKQWSHTQHTRVIRIDEMQKQAS
ncbi:glycosyltransferase family 2 protein [Gorillibacterium sp. sgz500922]|uniref:glycosyltransferase family 2 protein n=1 Tax=Gorillibacterium sp. sgz500922 TaxID=3446694 RepID=UPI003F67A4CA